MPTYEVTLWEKVTHTITVEAENQEQAREEAKDNMGEVEGTSQGVYASSVFEVS